MPQSMFRKRVLGQTHPESLPQIAVRSLSL